MIFHEATSAEAEVTEAEVNSILTASYEWGPSDQAVILQELLGRVADGWYGNGTHAAHLRALEARGLPTIGVPSPPTTTTTLPPTTMSMPASSGGSSWEDLARSVVLLYVDNCGGFAWTGSGTVVLDGGYVLTNAHVVADDAGNFCDLWIYAADSASEPPDWIADARVIPEAYDSDVDLAVIQLVDIDGQPTLAAGRDPIEIRDIDLGLGEEIKVLGYPGLGGDTITMTGGEISGWLGDYYKSSARSGPGVSGGAAFDATTGEYVGTPSGGSSTDVGEALVLVRPSSYALPLLQAAQQADLPPTPTTATTAPAATPVPGIAAACGSIGSLVGTYPVRTDRYDTNENPTDMVFDGTHIWVALGGGLPGADGQYGGFHVSKLRASDGALIGLYPTGAKIDSPKSLTFDGTQIWVISSSNELTLRPSDGAIVAYHELGGQINSSLFDGTHIWTSIHGNFGGAVEAWDLSGKKVIHRKLEGQSPTEMVFDGEHLWVAIAGKVTKLRADHGEVVGTYPAGGGNQDLAFDGTHIWASNHAADTVTRLRASDGALVSTHRVGNGPTALEFDGTHIWVTNTYDDSVTRLRASDGTTLGTYPVGDRPEGLEFDGAHIWVSNRWDDTVSKICATPSVTVP